MICISNVNLQHTFLWRNKKNVNNLWLKKVMMHTITFRKSLSSHFKKSWDTVIVSARPSVNYSIFFKGTSTKFTACACVMQHHNKFSPTPGVGEDK